MQVEQNNYFNKHMANPIKKLAGETAIYGLSTILARMINFFFVPIYTRILSQDGYGSYSEIMSYIAVMHVVLVLGLETGCFRFANNLRKSIKEKFEGSGKENEEKKEIKREAEKPFSDAIITVFSISLLFFGILALFSNEIASLMGYKGYGRMISYVGGVLALDSITAILFARLRYYQKAFKFALFKSIKILSELGFNLLLFFAVPNYLQTHPDSFLLNFIPAKIDFSYIIFAVFLSCIICTILFIPDFLKVKYTFTKGLWKKMMLYSLPIMIAGLPGTVNESLDRILFRFFAPAHLSWRAELGVYQAAVKLAVIMNLFIQMFRYAAEPFFFARAKEKGSNELYAKVMEYFIAFSMLIFLGVTLYIDLIGLILGKDFRGAISTVPFMLFSYMILGILFNVSMWYKLSGQTKYAVTITLLGLIVTAVVNVIFMPRFSYWASVCAHFLSCLTMLIYSAWLGSKYYPIPYKWKKICSYVGAGVMIYGVSMLVAFCLGKTGLSRTPEILVKLGINTILIVIYLAYVQHKTKLLKYKWAQI